MKYCEIKDIVIGLVKEANSFYISSYQICQQIEEKYPDLWEKLCTEYPSQEEGVEMGAGTGNRYSPASFVANTLKHYSKEVNELSQEYFSCEGVTFEKTIPGFTGNVLGIWAWKQ